jgi:hypothetical protein
VPDRVGPSGAPAGPRAPRIVELLGLPGAGKSTLARALLAGATRRSPEGLVSPERVLGTARLPLPAGLDASLRAGVDLLPPRAMGVARRVLWRAGSDDALAVLARTHPEFLELVAHAAPPPDADAAHVLRWRSWPLATIETHVALRRADAPGRTVLVEEGLVQRANTVCAGDPSLAARYFATQPVPDVLVVLDIDAELARDRIASRRSPALLRHAGLGPAQVLTDLERSVGLIATATDVLRGRGVVLLELDATEPTALLSRRVVDLIHHLPGPQPA